jgi:hypothetical protein
VISVISEPCYNRWCPERPAHPPDPPIGSYRISFGGHAGWLPGSASNPTMSSTDARSPPLRLRLDGVATLDAEGRELALADGLSSTASASPRLTAEELAADKAFLDAEAKKQTEEEVRARPLLGRPPVRPPIPAALGGSRDAAGSPGGGDRARAARQVRRRRVHGRDDGAGPHAARRGAVRGRAARGSCAQCRAPVRTFPAQLPPGRRYNEKMSAAERTMSREMLRLARQPALLTGGALRDYQMAGFEWMGRRWFSAESGIIADEMGLGKTIQVRTLMARPP